MRAHGCKPMFIRRIPILRPFNSPVIIRSLMCRLLSWSWIVKLQVGSGSSTFVCLPTRPLDIWSVRFVPGEEETPLCVIPDDLKRSHVIKTKTRTTEGGCEVQRRSALYKSRLLTLASICIKGIGKGGTPAKSFHTNLKGHSHGPSIPFAAFFMASLSGSGSACVDIW